MKRRCAEQAYSMIRNGMTIGLGGGETIQYLTEFIYMGHTKVKVVTPSMKTALNCQSHGIEVIPLWLCDHVDLAFDGCSQIDRSLHCLKSEGAIHTQEKIIGALADKYIILTDETKLVDSITFERSLSIEVLKEAYSYVMKQLFEMGLDAKPRTAQEKDGYVVSDDGNLIVDVDFSNVKDPYAANQRICDTLGVIDTALFTDVVDAALVAKKDGSVELIEK